MSEEIIEYLCHILNAINDIESFVGEEKIFEKFVNDDKTRFAVERALEIIGEAMSRVFKIDDSLPITDAKLIIYTRNRIIHGYDSVDATIIWRIIIKSIPILKQEILEIIEKK